MAHWTTRVVYRLAPKRVKIRWQRELLASLLKLGQSSKPMTWDNLLDVHHTYYPNSLHASSAASALVKNGYMCYDSSKHPTIYAITPEGRKRYGELQLLELRTRPA